MARSSILGGTHAPARAPGHDVDALGPSDSSDSGSDVQGERATPAMGETQDLFGEVTLRRGSDSDAQGTGERGSADGDTTRDGSDILPDRISRGLGMRSDEGLSAEELAEVDVEDLVADDDATLDDEIGYAEEDSQDSR